MPLESLVQYSTTQEQKINSINRKRSPHRRLFAELGPGISPWVSFRNSLWKKGLASLENRKPLVRSANPVPVPESIPSTCTTISVPDDISYFLRLDCSEFLVRDEYREAEKAVLEANEEPVDAFVVTGQPGIGKSVFLLWLLMRRLALGLPTVFQYRANHAILFHQGGTRSFRHLDDLSPYRGLKVPPLNHGRVWALIDSCWLDPAPAPVFQNSVPFFTVEAASPHKRYLEWTEDVAYRLFYMKTWDFSEVVQARPFIGVSRGGPYEEQELWHLYDKYGASPRALDRLTRYPYRYENQLTAQVDKIQPGTLRYILESPTVLEDSYMVTTIGPSSGNRELHRKRFASEEVFLMVWDAQMKYLIAEMEHFYTLFKNNAATAPAAGWIFEHRMHELLRAGGLVNLFPVLGHEASKNFIYNDYSASHKGDREVFQLANSEDHPLIEGAELKVGHYYRPRAKNFPTIDALFLIQLLGIPFPILLMLQMTLGDKHHVNELGLSKIDDLVLPLNTVKYFVVVTPSDKQPQITAPKTYFKQKRRKNGMDLREKVGKPDEVFPVFHCPVGTNVLFPTAQHQAPSSS